MIWLPPEIWFGRHMRGLPPGIGGDAAFRIFCTPLLSERRAANHSQLTERARFHLRHARWLRIPTPLGEMQAYIFEPERQIAPGMVLILHGWTGEASFMTAIAEPIRRAGFRVGLFDLPAHGLSDGRSTHLMDCARATLAVGEHLGPIHALVTHSFGGLISLVAAEGHAPVARPLQVKHAILIASPNELTEVTGHFSRHWDLEPAVRRAFERRLERVGGRPLSAFTAVKLLRASDCRAFIIHARDDVDVPFRCAEEIVAEVPGTEFQAFDGLGHRNILFASQAIRPIVTHLQRTLD